MTDCLSAENLKNTCIKFDMLSTDARARDWGFSLIELLVAVSIFGVMVALALPSFSAMLRNNQIRASAEALLNGLQQARGAAVSTNQHVLLTFTDGLTNSCVIKTASAKSWIISLDDPATPTSTCDSDVVNAKDPNLSTLPAPRILVKWSAVENSGKTQIDGNGIGQLTFDGFGRASAAATFNINMLGSGYSCGTHDNEARCLSVVVSIGGQARICDQQLVAGKLGAC